MGIPLNPILKQASNLMASLVAAMGASFLGGVVGLILAIIIETLLFGTLHENVWSNVGVALLIGACAALAGGRLVPLRGTLGTANLSIVWVILLALFFLDISDYLLEVIGALLLGFGLVCWFSLRTFWKHRAQKEKAGLRAMTDSNHLAANIRNFILFVVMGFPFGCQIKDEIGNQVYNFALMTADGEIYRTQIMQFMVDHRRVPKDLEEAGLERYSKNYGPWKYRTYTNPLAAGVHMGDYSKYGWEIGWGFSASYYNPLSTSDTAFKAEALDIYLLVLQYRLDVGRDPMSVEELGILPSWGEYGPWILESIKKKHYQSWPSTSISRVVEQQPTVTLPVLHYGRDSWWRDT